VGQRGHAPPKLLENIVILCFERRFSKQNSVIHAKSNIWPQKNFSAPPKFLGLLCHWAVSPWPNKKFFRGSQVVQFWGKRLKPSGAAYTRLKTIRVENMTRSSYQSRRHKGLWWTKPSQTMHQSLQVEIWITINQWSLSIFTMYYNKRKAPVLKIFWWRFWFIYAYVKKAEKIGRVIMRMMATIRKKEDS